MVTPKNAEQLVIIVPFLMISKALIKFLSLDGAKAKFR